MPRTITLLFTSAGRRNQLIRCFRSDAEKIGVAVRILAVDVNPELSPACHQADTSFKVPRCTTQEYLPSLLQICERERVDMLVPTIDTELAVLSANRDAFNACRTRVIVSEPSVVALAGNKLATSQQLAERGICTPLTLSIEEYQKDPARLRWPIIAKPNSGSASVGILRPTNTEELHGLTGEYIVQELWEGREYTVNMFFDQSGALRCAIPHLRIEVRAGEVSKGRTERISVLERAAATLSSAISGAKGPLCFQAIVRPDGTYAVFEINARFGGGFPLAHHAGARFSEWLLQEICGLQTSANNDWTSGITMLRYDDAVFTHG